MPGIGAAFLRCSMDVDAVARRRLPSSRRTPRGTPGGLGRHGIGSNYFWYLRDPAGNFAEYTTDLPGSQPVLPGSKDPGRYPSR